MINKNEPIRILHVLGALNRGGAETMVMNLYRNIDKSKIQFDFLIHTRDKCDYTEEILSLGGRIYTVDKFRGLNLISYINQFVKFYKSHPEYKIIHGHMRSTASIYLTIAKKFNRYTIAHSHNMSSGDGFSALVKNVLQYPLRYIPDYFFACSNAAGKWLFGKKIVNKKNFSVLKNAIKIDDFVFNEVTRKRIRRELNIENKFVLGNVARFHEQKNHKFLIEAFKEVVKLDDDFLLILIGEGELKSDIIDYVKNNQLTNNVIFLPSISNVNEYMQAFDAFLFPSKYEGLGIVAIEAQCASLKTLCSKFVPKEVAITNNIQFLPLEKKIWINEIRQLKTYQRNLVNVKLLYSSGYSIVESTEFLTNFYMQKYKELL